jgi:hypothetical protein
MWLPCHHVLKTHNVYKPNVSIAIIFPFNFFVSCIHDSKFIIIKYKFNALKGDIFPWAAKLYANGKTLSMAGKCFVIAVENLMGLQRKNPTNFNDCRCKGKLYFDIGVEVTDILQSLKRIKPIYHNLVLIREIIDLRDEQPGHNPFQ